MIKWQFLDTSIFLSELDGGTSLCIWMKKSATGSDPLQIHRGDKPEEMPVCPLMTFPSQCM